MLRWLGTVHRRVVTGFVLLVLLIAGCGGRPGVDGFYEVAGGQVDLWCDGGDGPAVMFLPAIGGDHSLVPIAEALADEAYVCFYDRPGDGETRPPDDPRSAAEDAADLHELIDVAALPAPMTLVAHSYGGLVAVVAAGEHPDDINGIVMVDASHPDQERRMDAVVTPEQRAQLDLELENFPYIDWYASLDEAAAAYASIPDVLMTVITASRGWDGCGADLPCEDLQAVWLEVQGEYGTVVPDARHVVVDTGHYVQDDDPDLVIREIRALLDRIAAREES
jgi:pimeloyl-ACP methyl ester carboxylesterase